MALSGSYDFNITRNQIIAGALRLFKIIDPTPQQFFIGDESLNVMIKEWQNDHSFLWKAEWKTKTFSSPSEITGSDSKIYTCIREHTAASNNKPITGADYSTYWYERGSTGGVHAVDTVYSSIGDFALDTDTISIEKAFIRDSNSDYGLDIIPFSKFLDLINKYNEGKPTLASIDWQLTPRLYLYKQPSETTYVLHYCRIKLIEDFDVAGNSPDFKARWIKALIWGLAADLSPIFTEGEAGLKLMQWIEAKATVLLKRAEHNDSEPIGDDFVSPAYEVN